MQTHKSVLLFDGHPNKIVDPNYENFLDRRSSNILFGLFIILIFCISYAQREFLLALKEAYHICLYM